MVGCLAADHAARLEVAPAAVSLMVGEPDGGEPAGGRPQRQGRRGPAWTGVDRREDDADRRRAIVSIAELNRKAVDAGLARGARAWRSALEPLTGEQRRVLAETLRSYERAITGYG
ncbi:hypothetical protein [Microbispora bryophytorum]|uniref:hypothetical protein n=1 Tax=Microbispora bryophytorum TaxID=1460882 RepID=UPI0033E246E1